MVQPATFDDVEYDFASNYGSGYRDISIFGSLTRQGIKDKQDRGETLQLQGATSGVIRGEIAEVDSREFATLHDATDGDSGAPVYDGYYNSGWGRYAYVGGVHSRVDSNDSNKMWHTLMESIEDELNVTV